MATPTRATEMQPTVPRAVSVAVAADRQAANLTRVYCIFALVLIFAGVGLLPLDTRIAAFFHAAKDWEWKPIQLAEAFAHSWGVALILMAVIWLAPQKTPGLLRVSCLALGSGLAANLGKVSIVRVRPFAFDLSLPIQESFGSWWPFFTAAYNAAPGGKSSAWQAFPSAHTATAVGLAAGLSYLFPQGRFYFWMLAVMAGMQRMVSESHFSSDVLWGAAVGMLVSAWLFSRRGSEFFDRFEQQRGMATPT